MPLPAVLGLDASPSSLPSAALASRSSLLWRLCQAGPSTSLALVLLRLLHGQFRVSETHREAAPPAEL